MLVSWQESSGCRATPETPPAASLFGGLHCAYATGARQCDTYTVHKHAVRAIAAGHRMTPTFMAVPQTGIGSGLHFHISLWHDNKPAYQSAVGADLPDVLQQSLTKEAAAVATVFGVRRRYRWAWPGERTRWCLPRSRRRRGRWRCA
ncbi:hypothetical protein [Streptomyces fagopyri]|uniref:hypothetical protein n=1 Tax=Streptomyces fagopyri TaxID=2662397 RepID=UPI0033EAEC4A